MEKKTLTTKELFCGMPYLRAYFSEMERKIRTFEPQEGISEGVEKLKQKKRELLQIAKGLDAADLQVLYYLHNIHPPRRHQILNKIEKLFVAQEELCESLAGERGIEE